MDVNNLAFRKEGEEFVGARKLDPLKPFPLIL